jgi:hypothetical protein
VALVRLVSQPPAGETGAGQVAAATDNPRPQGFYVAGTVLFILAGVFIGWRLTERFEPKAFVPEPGVSIFAVFYIAAQGLERLAELIKLVFPQVGATKVDGERKDKATAEAERNKTLADALNSIKEKTSPDTEGVAAKQRTVSQIRANTSVILWGLNSFLASVACGWLGLYLLDAVGVEGMAQWIDIAITGLAIGGGSKPLHDLISNIEKAKESKQDPSETGGGAS